MISWLFFVVFQITLNGSVMLLVSPFYYFFAEFYDKFLSSMIIP